MTIIDLTHPIAPGMPVYPGTEPPVIVTGCTIDSAGFWEKKITMFSHTGTHMDAPAHMIKGGKTLDQLPMGQFFGKAFVLHRGDRQDREIGVEELLPHAQALAGAEFVLLDTGWSRFWGKEQYFARYPVLSAAAATLLAELPLKGIGVDTISVDAIDSQTYPVHNALLKKDFVIIENLTNLDQIPGMLCTLCCFPLKLVEADGSPVRAVAFPAAPA